MNNYKELIVWQKARVFTKDIYLLLNTFPSDEKYGLISQIKRATISITSNIAEGSGRDTKKDFSRFLDIALGSCYEVENQLILSSDLKFIKENELDTYISTINEIEKMLIGLIKSIRNN